MNQWFAKIVGHGIRKTKWGHNAPLILTTINNNDMDLIYLFILTPVTIAVMYGAHCIKRNNKRFEQIEEAKPYQFERDEYIPEFNEFTQMLYQRRMYKGKSKLN